MGLDFGKLAGSEMFLVPHVGELAVRMLIATVLGALVAYKAWRLFLPWATPPTIECAHAQTLIAAVGAIMAVVIGDHAARAFGLVGLGAFIRFRSGISDPRDAVVMLVMIAIGMACGIGMPVMAAMTTVFVSLLLIVLDISQRRAPRRTLVTIQAESPPLVKDRLLQLFPGSRVVEFAIVAAELGKDSGKIVLEVDLGWGLDAASIRERLDAHEVPGIRRVAVAFDG
jgi:hypothetical protein